MIETVAYCLNCKNKNFIRFHTYWECKSCGQKYPCTKGIPKLFIEENIQNNDRRLRDTLYNGLLGRFYNIIMPFLSLPARPFRLSLGLWGGYLSILVFEFFLLIHVVWWAIIDQFKSTSWSDGLVLLLLLGSAYFFYCYPYIWNLLILAIPVKISLAIRKFQPLKSFQDIHSDFQEEYINSEKRLKILDIATGSCNSLYRHGWMELEADYLGIDLSEQMLLKGANFMAHKDIGADFAFADAHDLPFETESYDIVTCYGAVNGYTNIAKALSEMVRVTKIGGKLLFLDEQLYSEATFIERLYFEKVLSSHDVVRECPADKLPSNLENIEVHQVYQFYYICTAQKSRS